MLVLGLLVTACSGGSRSVLDTMRLAMGGDQSGALHAPQNPAFQYLKVTSYGRPAYLVLGYTEPASGAQVWYSAQGEVIKLQNGRLVGALGLETEWRDVRWGDVPAWQSLTHTPDSTEWTFRRERDVMPGYRFNVSESLRLRAVSLGRVKTQLGKALPSLADSTAWLWFEENTTDLPPAFYALDAKRQPPQVVWTYQCLSPGFCLSLEPWAPVVSRQNTRANSP